MKTQIRMRMVMVGLTLGLLAGGEAGAQTVCTWNNTAGGNWSVSGASGWTPQVPDLAGDTADVSTLAVGGTITIDAFTPRTVGILKAGDTTTAYAGWTFNGPGYLSVANGGCLIMNNSGAGAQINRPIAADTATLTLNMPALLLNDNLTFNLTGSGPITVGNINTVVKAVSGSRTLTAASASTGGVTINSAITDGGGTVALVQNSSGSGALTLANDNTYSGGTTLSAGTLTISSAIPSTMSALGTGPLTINGGRLSFNGYTITNAIAFPANFNFTAGGAFTTVLAGPITPLTGNLTLTASGSSQALKISSPIGENGGSYGVSVVSDRTHLMLTGTHTYSGPTSVATAPSTAVLRLGDGVTDGMVGGNIDCGGFNRLYWNVAGNLTYGGSKVILATYNNAQQFFKEGPGTLTFNGTVAQNWASHLTIQDGTVVVDFSNSSVNDLIGKSMLMQGGTLSIKGHGSAARSQTLATGNGVTLGGNGVPATGAFGITLNNNGGPGVTLTLPASITRNANTVLNIDLTAGGTLARATTATMGYATINDGSVGFARANGTSIVRLTGQGALANNSNASGTDYVTSGTLTHDNGPWAVNSLVLDATGGNSLLDLGDATSIVTDSQLGLLMIGGNNYTVQDGQWGAANSEVIVHTMGSGNLTMNSAVSSGTGSLTKNGSGVLVLGNANAYTGATVIHGGTLRLGASGVISDSSTVTITRNGTLDVNGQTETIAGLLGGASVSPFYFGGIVDNSTGTGSLTVNPGANSVFGGTIQNTGGTLALTKAGTFTLTLTGSNTYTGGTTISGGTLKVGDGTLTGDGSITGNVSVGATYTLQFSNYGPKTYAGSISGTGNLVLDPKGPGALTLSGNSSGFSGPITFWPNGNNPPQLNINHDNALGTGTLTLKPAGNLLGQRLGNTSGSKRTINNAVTLEVLASPAVRFVGPDELELAGTVTFSGSSECTVDAGRKLTLSGVVTGTGGLLKRGAGTLVISNSGCTYGTGTYTSPTIAQGTLEVPTCNNNGADGPFGKYSGGVAILGSDGNYGTLRYTGSAASLTCNRLFGFGNGGGGIIDVADAGATLELSGAMTGDSSSTSGALIKAGPGTLYLSSASCGYLGKLTVREGTMKVASVNENNANGPLGRCTAATVTLGGTSTTGTLWYTGGDATKARTFSLAAGGTGAFNTDDSTGTERTLTLSGDIDGSGSLIKTGADALSFTTAKTYSGNTTVSAGKLKLSNTGTINNSPVITVAGGATLDSTGYTLSSGQRLQGTGTVVAPSSTLTVGAGSTLSPGASGAAGTLTQTSGTLIWAGGGTNQWELSQVDTAQVDQDAGKGTLFDWYNGSGAALNVTASSGNKFTIKITALNPPVENWDNTKSYTWTIGTFPSGFSGVSGGNFNMDTSSFGEDLGVGGTFFLNTVVNDLRLNFTPGVANQAPVIQQTGPLTATMSEDGSPTAWPLTTNAVSATDPDGDTVNWSVGTSPAHGNATVSGSGLHPSVLTYTPYANYYGSDSFWVRADDGTTGETNIEVQVTVDPINDAPTNTVLPGIAGTRLWGNTLTVTNGLWNDNADTNATYTHAVFTNNAFVYQWQRADDAAGTVGLTNLLNQTNTTYTLTRDDKFKYFSVRVTCTDSGWPAPGGLSTLTNSAWLRETSTVPTVVTFTNTLGDSAWGNYSNWVPDDVPTPTLTAVIGDTSVKSPVTAVIGTGDTAATKELTLGNNTGASGSLNMTGGTLTGNGTLTLGSGTSSTGVITQTAGTMANYNGMTLGSGARSYASWTLSGSSMSTGMTSGSLLFGGGSGAVSRLVVQDSATWSNVPNVYWRLASGADSDAGVEVKGGKFYVTRAASGAMEVGYGAGSVGRVTVEGGSAEVGNSGLGLGANASGTGIVTVAGGTLTAQISIGSAGAGYVYVTNSGTLNALTGYGLTMGGGAGSNAYLLVDGNGSLNAAMFTLGNAGGNVSVADLRGGSSYVDTANAGNGIVVGLAAGSTGIVNVAGGRHVWTHWASGGYTFGSGTNALGRVTVSGGSLTTIGEFSYGYYGVGELNIAGGAFTNNSILNLGRSAGGVGRVTVTGGTWVQGGALNVGSAAAGVTGVVSVVNCVSTNISGAVTVGGGTTVGDRYGSVTISNATFGGSTAMTVLTNGFVELTGTGSVLRCSTFTCRGGALTNRVRQLAGGLDVTSSANTALVITNGGSVYLSFDEGPAGGVSGNFWGLRWAGNRTAELAALTNANALAWGGAAVSGVGIYTNTTHTFVGYFINTPPVVTNSGKAVTINMSEDGTFTPATLYATDAEGDTLTWTNGAVAPANGSVGVINVASSNLTTYTYAPAGNWNGTDSFTVKVSDGRGGVDTGTVTVIVAAVNDPPVCSAGPTVSGLYQIGVTLSNDYTGAWSDATDTNVSGSSSFTFTWQWQRADSEGGAGAGNIADATNVTYLLGTSDTGKYVRVAVTCTDDGVGSGGNQSVTTNTVWTLVTAVNNLPVITNGNGTVVANLAEDGGPTDLQALLNLGATDDDPGQTATLVWTNSTSPNNGTASVSGTGASPAMIFTPNPNWNGTNTFVVRVTDTVGGSDEITVEVRVVPVNDPPTNTVAPGYTGTRLVGNVLTVTNGVWDDNVDTNASYSGSALAFAYQWQRATNGSGDGLTTIVNATNAAYTLTWEDKYKWVRAAVTCTDGGFPLPGSNATANTSWLQELSTVPTLVTFTNLVGNRLWNVAGNWAPADVPTPTMTTVIGDTNVLSPATALIGASDTALTKELTLGNNAGASGSLEMSGGTLTGNGTLTLGSGTSSTGVITQTGGTLSSYNNVYVGRGNTSDVTWAVSGSSVVTGLMGNFYMGGDNGTVGAGSKARLTVSGSAVWSNTFNGVVAYVAAGQNSDSTLEANGGTLYLALGNNTTIPVGSQPGSIGRLNVTSGRMDVVVSQGVVLGANATSTGIVTVAGGSFTAGRMGIGNPGMGSVYVNNTGAFTLTDSIGIGLTMGYATGSNAYFLVDGSGSYTGKQFSLGKAAGNVSVADLRGGSTYVGSGNAGDGIVLGSVAGSTGIVNVAGGRHVWEHGASGGYGIGQASNSLGRVTITGGSLTTIGEFSYGYYGVGELNIAGGAFTNNSILNLGRSAGGVGRVTVTGGTWVQGGALNVGSAAAGVTGVVSVANCVSTNITGAVTVGGGTTGDRYGSVAISNATFGGGTAVTVLTNGFVELTGTGSVLRCSTFTCRGGTVTNHIRQFAGGVDVTSSLDTALVITNGGTMFLSFDQGPVAEGDFWGLRWAGNSKAGLLQGMTNSGALSWDDSAAGGSVKIFTNATHTMVGYVPLTIGTTFRFR